MDRILQGAEEAIPEEELEQKLERSRSTGTPLTVKQGFDPTRPDLHIGHAVSLHKLRTFQEMGHRVVFVIGDFTARIGDPSGQDETRPVLSEEEVRENLATYREQVFSILDPEETVIRQNSRWLAELGLEDVLELTSRVTVARMLERDDFATRYEESRPISLHEFVYPIMQGYDSVELDADVELGGTDQRFNLLLARTLQERAGQDPQVCLIMPLLRGTDGERKMSKTYDNYIGLSMEPGEMFGRTMSIPDHLLPEWIRLAVETGPEEREERISEAGDDPLAVKRWLARRIVARYHSSKEAEDAEEAFDRVHRHGGVPEDVPEYEVDADPDSGTRWIGYALQDTQLVPSTSKALRLLEQGGVRVDGEVVEDDDLQLEPGEYLLQRGKRDFARIRIRG
ncbi:MAG: tyrosine--tRNA ligase [Candidatus Palauibacterales bacterium]|nr:tyrosine--tRNA ligase [Candidatus Palauibacterales bacterium]